MEKISNDTLPVLYVKDVVLAFIKALNNDDLTTARTYVWEYMTFKGVLTTRNGASNYFDDLKQMNFSYDIKKVFAEGNDVCLCYDFTISGVTLFACAWFQLAGGKIASIRTVYDPRPVLDLIC